MEKTEYRKIQGIMRDHSLGVILPKSYAINLNLTKGDFVRSISSKPENRN